MKANTDDTSYVFGGPSFTWSPHAKHQIGYLPHIDGMRAIAVLAVLVFHAIPSWLPGGFVGVDVFFVISGYLISTQLFRGVGEGQSLRGILSGFYVRRINRILPALIVVLGGALVAGYALLMPAELVNLCHQSIAGAAFCLNIFIAGQTDYFRPDPASTPLLHLWSLGVEEQFYIVWPLFLYIAYVSRVRPLSAVIFATALSFTWNYLRLPGLVQGAFYLPQFRLWELALGACLAAVPIAGKNAESFPSQNTQNILSVIGAGFLVAGFVICNSASDLPSTCLLLPNIGALLLIYSGGSSAIGRHILSQRMLTSIGLISFPLYLWHWPVLTFSKLAGYDPNSKFVILNEFALTFLLAWLTYIIIERPARRYRRSAPAAYILLGANLMLIALAACVIKSKGIPGRFPPLLNAIASYKHDPQKATRQGVYFLIGDQNESVFLANLEHVDPQKSTLYLWGDSHAASLYPGLNAVFGNRYNIIQRTTAKTPPFIPEHFNPGNARQINGFVLDSILRERPEYVVLHANWSDYDWSQIELTIRALRIGKTAHIILVGPVPQWLGSLPQQLYNHARRYHGAEVPTRMLEGLDPRIKPLDQNMSALADQLGVTYISPLRIFQNNEGCLVRTGETPDSLITYDSSHLTVAGSEYLADRLKDRTELFE